MTKKRIKIRKYIVIAIAVLALIYLFNIVNKKVKTEILLFDEVEEIVKGQGIVIKNENILRSNSSGNVELYYDEGQKINVGMYAAKVGNSPVVSGYSGLISYYIDGYEEMYNLDSALDITTEGLNTIIDIVTKGQKPINLKDVVSVETNGAVAKVVDNFNYYVACSAKKNGKFGLEIGDYVRVKFNDEMQTVYGIVRKVVENEDNIFLILSFDDFFNSIYNKRLIDVNIIKAVHKGILVKKASVREIDGKIGVYIKDISNIIRFYPISIIGENDKYYVASEGYFVSENERNKIEINGEMVQTIKAFDKLILNPDEVEDGQISE